MNAHAVQVERRYGRPVMSAFHAVFSIGGVVAALVGARTLSWGWSPPATLAAVCAVALAIAAAAAPALLRPEPKIADQVPTTVRRKTPRRIWALAALALMLMLSEGVANDWSVLHLRDILDAPAATAALAYGAFATAMTVGRLLTDRVAARFGAIAILRYGASVAALGLTIAALSPWISLALVGWTTFGIGMSGCVPGVLPAGGLLRCRGEYGPDSKSTANAGTRSVCRPRRRTSQPMRAYELFHARQRTHARTAFGSASLSNEYGAFIRTR